MDVAVVRVFHALAGVLAPTFSVWCQIDGDEVGAIRSFALGPAVVDVGRVANPFVQVGGARTEATSPVAVRGPVLGTRAIEVAPVNTQPEQQVLEVAFDVRPVFRLADWGRRGAMLDKKGVLLCFVAGRWCIIRVAVRVAVGVALG